MIRRTYGPAGGREPWHRVVVMVLLPIRLLFRVDFRGVEHVPARGGVIVVSNHISLFDPLPLALLVHRAGRRPRFLVMAELFRWPLLGGVLRGVRQIPVERESPDASRALDAAIAAVRNGECVIVYPEGGLTRDPDGWPMPAKTGVGRLALATGAPVVPIGQWGAQEFPRLWRWVRIRAWAGRPCHPTGTAREATDEVMAQVTGLVAAIRGTPPPARRTGLATRRSRARGVAHERAEPGRRVVRPLPEAAAAQPDDG